MVTHNPTSVGPAKIGRSECLEKGAARDHHTTMIRSPLQEAPERLRMRILWTHAA
jgi:hypothetical protein